MCGIAGFSRPEQSRWRDSDAETLSRMTASLAHRGPDACGHALFPGAALGHRRLAIIDLSGGAQPMESPEHELCATFNGEIYNYLELNAELAGRGHRVRTRSDTETLLLAYAEWGERCVEKFNGMFAFAIHDRKRNVFFGARDRAGKKPFYYVHDGPFFAFASEPKALLQHPAVQRSCDWESAARYLLFEHVPAPYAIYRGMRKLCGGERFVFDCASGALKVSRYWDFPFAQARVGPASLPAGTEASPTQAGTEAGAATDSEEHWIERIRHELRAAVQRRLMSDVPLGVFLSGGIDSTAVTAMMAQIQGGAKVKSFAIGFSDARFDETRHARAVADFLGTEHYEERLDPRASIDILPAVAAMLDEPFADPSILPCYLLSRFARRQVTVTLGGDGGDELFAGYDTFRALPWLRAYNALVPSVVDRCVVRPLAGRLRAGQGNFNLDFKAKQFLRGAKAAENERLWRWLGAFVPQELPRLLAPEFLRAISFENLYEEVHALNASVSGCDPAARDAYVYARTYLSDGVLVKVDRATMANSLEARSPLLDRDFMDMACAMPSRFKVRRGTLKYLFKRAMKGLVPDAILKRPKKGFGIPVAAWFQGELRELLQDTLSERKLREGGLFSPAAVGELVREHLSGRCDNRKPLWTLFMFEQWRQRWLK